MDTNLGYILGNLQAARDELNHVKFTSEDDRRRITRMLAKLDDVCDSLEDFALHVEGRPC